MFMAAPHAAAGQRTALAYPPHAGVGSHWRQSFSIVAITDPNASEAIRVLVVPADYASPPQASGHRRHCRGNAGRRPPQSPPQVPNADGTIAREQRPVRPAIEAGAELPFLGDDERLDLRARHF